MNIWLDPAHIPQGHFNEQPDTRTGSREDHRDHSDCPPPDDCDPPDCGFMPPIEWITHPSLNQDSYYLESQKWQTASDLYSHACSDKHYLVCDPTGVGRMAVLDAEAYRILRSFRSPTTLQEISLDFPTSTSLTRIVSLFVVLGFLQSNNISVAPYKTTQNKTLSAWLHITNACNLRCSYCYIAKTAEHMAETVSKHSIDAVIRSAIKHHYGSIKLKYAGGESTLRLPQIFATHDYALGQAQQHGLSLSGAILTNGTIMPIYAIEQLKQRHMGVSISLDGVGDFHDRQRPMLNGKGSFASVDRTISRLLAHHLTPSINVTVTQRNLAELPALMDYLLQRNLRFTLSYYRENTESAHLPDLQFADRQMIEGMRAAFARIEAQLPKRRLIDSLIDKGTMSGPGHQVCSMGRDYLVIDQRGGVAKCPVDIARPITTIQSDDPLRAVREDRRGVQAVAVEEREGCRDCTWRAWCRGGCPLLTYRLTGRNDVKSPNCAIYKALYPDALRLEALRLLTYGTALTFS